MKAECLLEGPLIVFKNSFCSAYGEFFLVMLDLINPFMEGALESAKGNEDK